LTPVTSKLFESVMLSIYRKDLKSDHLQFGFKSDISCSHALFSLSGSVRYYNKPGSKVYCAFLDASKAFDKVLTYGLSIKLKAATRTKDFSRQNFPGEMLWY